MQAVCWATQEHVTCRIRVFAKLWSDKHGPHSWLPMSLEHGVLGITAAMAWLPGRHSSNHVNKVGKFGASLWIWALAHARPQLAFDLGLGFSLRVSHTLV